MTVNWNEVILKVCLIWCFTLVLFFLINWNNNSYEYYKVEEYFKAKSCYTVTDNYNNAPRVIAYCGDGDDR